jgi:hypothetical protein
MVQKLDVHRSHKWSHNVQYYESEEQKIARHGEQHGN